MAGGGLQEEKDKKKKKKKANRKDKQPRGSTRAGGDEIEESLAARNLECYAWLQVRPPFSGPRARARFCRLLFWAHVCAQRILHRRGSFFFNSLVIRNIYYYIE